MFLNVENNNKNCRQNKAVLINKQYSLVEVDD